MDIVGKTLETLAVLEDEGIIVQQGWYDESIKKLHVTVWNLGDYGGKGSDDAENWFYMKFVEWGTTKQPPQDFLYNTMEECRGQWDTIADQEYQKLLNEKLGG